jgi:hypothetical protein
MRRVTRLDGDRERMTSPICTYCTHLHVTQRRCCDAYPKARSIPAEIWEGTVMHDRVRPDQKGTAVFQKTPEATAAGVGLTETP